MTLIETEIGDRGKASLPDFPRGTVLAFDFGEKRIGVAVGDHEIGMAHPLEVIAAESNAVRFKAISVLVDAWHAASFVVGLPANMDGSEHELSRLARRFAARLARTFAIPVALVDERLSSVEAESRLREQGVTGRRQKMHVDSVAAQAILQSHFDAERRDAS